MSLVMVLVLLAMVVPLAANALAGAGHSPEPWHRASMESTRLGPDPATTPEAVVQVYAAPAFSWRGIFAVHCWIVVKPSGAPHTIRWDVVGWGGPPVVRRDFAAADGLWFGKRPRLLLDRRGDGIDALIDRIAAAARDYPHDHAYRTWPGPNSNTFVAHVARQVPELRLDLPASALGKDWAPWPRLVLPAPSGTGVTLTLAGALGLTLAVEEGIELNLLGFGLGVDVKDMRLRLPGIGWFPW